MKWAIFNNFEQRISNLIVAPLSQIVYILLISNKSIGTD